MKIDADIRRDVESEIRWDPRIDERVSGGWITLRGEVDCSHVRVAAENAVRH
jgi:hypothetical protein